MGRPRKRKPTPQPSSQPTPKAGGCGGCGLPGPDARRTLSEEDREFVKKLVAEVLRAGDKGEGG